MVNTSVFVCVCQFYQDNYKFTMKNRNFPVVLLFLLMWPTLPELAPSLASGASASVSPWVCAQPCHLAIDTFFLSSLGLHLPVMESRRARSGPCRADLLISYSP
jgi:hypothetical protein